MVALTEISIILNSLKTMKDIAETMIGLRDAEMMGGKVRELNGVIIDAQSSIFKVNEERASLIEAVRDLEEKIAAMEKWATDKDRYELQAMPGGTFAYALKEGVQPSEPAHYICANCYQDSKKSILQAEMRAPLAKVYVCPRCHADFYLSGIRGPAHSHNAGRK